MTKNWIPKELRTSTSQTSAPNEETTIVPNNYTLDAETVVIDNGSHEDVTIDAARFKFLGPTAVLLPCRSTLQVFPRSNFLNKPLDTPWRRTRRSFHTD